MINWIKNKIYNWRFDHGYFRIDELTTGGRCGLCGKWIPDTIFPTIWPWGICEQCVKDYGEDKSDL